MASATGANIAPAAASLEKGTSSNMYRVGDYVFFESSASGPFAIRRIEELNKTATGNVEARVMCFYRRAEIPSSLVPIADKHHWGEADMEQDSDDEDDDKKSENCEKALLKSREVFLSRQTETLPATLIRGKCSVTLLSEVETFTSYTSREDAFFYALVFDPHQKTLLADRGNIRIGSEYQAAVPAVTKEVREEELEELQWQPNNDLEEDKIDQFVIISRSVGTFARALDCSSSVKQPSLHMSAAAASRDITVLHAYQALHGHQYDISQALASLVPATGPVLCRDEMEDWSSAEANLFEEAIEKYGKDFNGIKKDFLPWKSMRNIIEYFFMWKTTDRYVQQKRVKALESENKLKQVYVPSYTRKSTRVTGPSGEVMVLGKECETSYPDAPKYSWSQYKKYGKFLPITGAVTDDTFVVDKTFNSAARLAQLRPGLIIEPGSPSKGGKTRAAFYLRTTPLTRAARRVTSARLSHYARRPTKLIDMKAMRTEVIPKLGSRARVIGLNKYQTRQRAPLSEMCVRMGQSDSKRQEWLVLRKGAREPIVEAWPRPAKRPDGSYIYERVPNSGGDGPAPGRHQMLYKKRAYEEKPVEVVGSKAGKTGGTQQRNYSVNQVAPKGTRKIATLTRVAGGQKTVISWQDAPDDLFYRAGAKTKKTRKQLTVAAIRKAARKPFRRIL